MNRNNCWLLITVAIAMASCEPRDYRPLADAPTSISRPAVSYQPHVMCPDDAVVDFDVANNEYVLHGTLNFSPGGNENKNAFCYMNLNKGEYYLCSAYMYLTDGLSFDPTPPQEGEEQTDQGPLSPDQRLEAVSKAVYFAAKANSEVLQGLRADILTGDRCPQMIIENDASYHRYAASLLADSFDVLEMATREGAELSVGLSDGLRSTYGSFVERTRQIWGGEGVDPALGLRVGGYRVEAFAWNHGLPHSAIVYQYEDDEWSMELGTMSLPLCLENGSDPAVRRGVDLLLRIGVPVAPHYSFQLVGTFRPVAWLPWSRYYDPGDIWPTAPYPADCVVDAVNALRHESGLAPQNGHPDLTYAEILERHGLTDETLESAARLLYDETRIRLHDLDIQDIDRQSLDGQSPTPKCYYLRGLDRAGMYTQDIEARAYVGMYAIGGIPEGGGSHAGSLWFPTAPAYGLEPQAALLAENIRCMLDLGTCNAEYLWPIIAEISDPQATNQLQQTLEYLESLTGSRYLEYQRRQPPNPSDLPSVTITPEGFAQSELGDLQFYLVDRHYQEKYQGMNGALFRFLSCFEHGRYPTGPCNLGSYRATCEQPGQGDGSCTIALPTVSGLLSLPKRYVVVTTGDQVLDVLAETRPSEVGTDFGQTWRIRHYLDDVEVRSRVRRVIAREPRNCAAPTYNSLGLRYDMPVPLENELTSDSDNYEDSFAYYVQRARDAAAYAGRVVQTAINRQDQDQIATTQVENTRQDALDRIEQICGEGRESCVVERRPGVTPLSELAIIPAVQELDDCQKPDRDRIQSDPIGFFEDYRDYINCSTDTLLYKLGQMEIEDLPQPIYDAAGEGTLSTLDFAQFGGEYKIALLDLNNAIRDIASQALRIKATLDALKNDIAANELNFISMQFQVAAHILDALAALSGSILNKLDPAANARNGLQAAAATCRAVAVELQAFASQFQFINQMIAHMEAIEQSSLSIEKTVTMLQQSLERVELLELEQQQSRDRAERRTDEVIAQLAGGGTLKEYRKFSLLAAVRARRAVRRAKKMAFIARRALETKMAVNLSEEREAGIGEDPPSKWADSLYTMMLAEPDQMDPTVPAEQALSEYVRKLEDYVYYYPFQYPFADGSDTAVLSLRDDLTSLDESCEIPGSERNLFTSSEDFTTWYPVSPDYDSGVKADFALGPTQTSNPTADVLTFGCGPSGKNPGEGIIIGEPGEVEALRCAELSSEAVDGIEGIVDYVGSVFLKALDPPSFDVAIALYAEYRSDQDPGTVLRAERAIEIHEVNTQWQRLAVAISIPAPAAGEHVTLRLEITPKIEPREQQWGVNAVFRLLAWGAQLEGGLTPSAYEATPHYVLNPICQTQTVVDPWTGEPTEIVYVPPARRSQRLRQSFRVKCFNDDFSSADTTVAECYALDASNQPRGGVEYLERDFSITLGDIESGRVLGQGEIGVGNYNYRIDSLAVNLVGTNVKDCSLDPQAGTSCYTSQFIPYDLVQDGRVWIRNHAGVALPFNLAIGRIHQGKALAAERLLTNPLSSTDSALIQQYTKREFRGRPIQGEYTVRVYATPSLRWANVEDLQILVNYRYWSPFSNP